MNPVEDFKKWFNGLTKQQQLDVANYLRGNKGMQITEGLFSGPVTIDTFLGKGVFSGPISSSSTSTCPTCGKPY